MMSTPAARYFHPRCNGPSPLPPAPSSLFALSETTKCEQEFAAIRLQELKPAAQEKGTALASGYQEEQCETPQRKVGVWSQQLDNWSTAKREAGIESPSRGRFRTPPKRTSKPTIEELERWDRMERETNRR